MDTVGPEATEDGQLLLHSEHENSDAPHTQGVGFMLSKQVQRSLTGWQTHGSRIITASIRSKKKKINLIFI